VQIGSFPAYNRSGEGLMVDTYTKTAIALQGGGALGAYAFGALKRIYEVRAQFPAVRNLRRLHRGLYRCNRGEPP
jgi:hypothetical protein